MATTPPASSKTVTAPKVEASQPPNPKAKRPLFSREGVLLNPDECHIAPDGTVSLKD